jgi:hypothetical protein
VPGGGRGTKEAATQMGKRAAMWKCMLKGVTSKIKTKIQKMEQVRNKTLPAAVNE